MDQEFSTGDAPAINPLPPLDSDNFHFGEEKLSPVSIFRVPLTSAFDGGKTSTIPLRGPDLRLWVEVGTFAGAESEAFTASPVGVDKTLINYAFSHGPTPRRSEIINLANGPAEWHFKEGRQPRNIRIITPSAQAGCFLCVATGWFDRASDSVLQASDGFLNQMTPLENVANNSMQALYVKNSPMHTGGTYSSPGGQPGAAGVTIPFAAYGVSSSELTAQGADFTIYGPPIRQVAEVIEIIAKWNGFVPGGGTAQLQGRMAGNNYNNIGAAFALAGVANTFATIIRATKQAYFGYRCVFSGYVPAGGTLDVQMLSGFMD